MKKLLLTICFVILMAVASFAADKCTCGCGMDVIKGTTTCGCPG